MSPMDPIEVVRHGDDADPHLILLHGGPGAPGSLRSLARVLGEAFPCWEPIQRRSGSQRLSVARHVEDLGAVTPVRSCYLGWSFGAMLGLSYAALYPDRVNRLILVGCGTYDLDSRAAYDRAMRDRTNSDDVARLRARLAAAPDTDARTATFRELAATMTKAQDVDVLPDDTPFEVDTRGFEETWTDVLRLQDEGIEPGRFAAIECPVTMIHGAEDPHPGPATRARLRRYVPSLDYIELPRCGHRPWLERAARDPFLALIRDLVRER